MEPRIDGTSSGLLRDYLIGTQGSGVKSPFDMIRKSPWMPSPQPNSDIITRPMMPGFPGESQRPISNQIGPGFGQPMSSGPLYDMLRRMMDQYQGGVPRSAPQPRMWNPAPPRDSFRGYQPMPTQPRTWNPAPPKAPTYNSWA